MHKREHLRWFDLAVLTVIFWGQSILSSTQAYIALWQGTGDTEGATDFSAADNYAALRTQVVLLLVALLYLKFRDFDFRSWTIRFRPKDIGSGVLLFVGAALTQDLYSLITGTFAQHLPFPCAVTGLFTGETFSTVLYSLFNGFYEELYFLGMCLAVKKEHWKWALPFSLLIRVSFHTYQGTLSALGIGLVFGLYMFFFYRKSESKNLLPFFFAHALADIFGLSLLWMVR